MWAPMHPCIRRIMIVLRRPSMECSGRFYICTSNTYEYCILTSSRPLVLATQVGHHSHIGSSLHSTHSAFAVLSKLAQVIAHQCSMLLQTFSGMAHFSSALRCQNMQHLQIPVKVSKRSCHPFHASPSRTNAKD